ncbi:MAG: hypothetical protein ACYCVV_20515 [Acidimicrobiales bacterium]
MSSFALDTWGERRSRDLDELDEAHAAVGGDGPGRRYATRQINHAYVVAVASQFQAFCRDLHSEAADLVAAAISAVDAMGLLDGAAAAKITLIALTRRREVDRGNANPTNIAIDFKSFDLDIWEHAKRHDKRTLARQRKLEQLNICRNAIAHQDFDFSKGQLDVLGGRMRIGLTEARAFRAACDQLAASFDEALARHLAPVVGGRPW